MRMTPLIAASVATLATLGLTAAAQAEPLRLNVQPRSFLDPGKTVSPYSAVNPASAQGQMVSYLASPPWINMRDRFGEGALPDPVTNGPFIGGRSILGPVDLGGDF